MSTFHDFLVWFDGWSENIEGQPSSKQWERLKAKVSEVRNVEPVPSAVPLVPQAANHSEPTGLKTPTTEREWRTRFLGVLVETAGMDMESAGEVWSDYKAKNTINLALDPEMAAMAASGVMN